MDLLGLAVSEARADAALAARVGNRIAGGDFDPAWSKGKPDPRPCVVLVSGGRGRSPFGPGSSRTGLQELNVIARCYGAADADGDERVAMRTSDELAFAVADAFHNRGLRRHSGGRSVFISDVVTGGGPSMDPVTRWRYAITTFRMVAPAQAAA